MSSIVLFQTQYFAIKILQVHQLLNDFRHFSHKNFLLCLELIHYSLIQINYKTVILYSYVVLLNSKNKTHFSCGFFSGLLIRAINTTSLGILHKSRLIFSLIYDTLLSSCFLCLITRKSYFKRGRDLSMITKNRASCR